VDRFIDGKLDHQEVPMRNAMNEVLRDEYIKDNLKGINYWIRIPEKEGVEFEFHLPHRRFNRTIGDYAAGRFDLEGQLIDEATWNSKVDEWLPTPEDYEFVKSLMIPERERGKFASWIAAPPRGINSQNIDFEYAKL
jgi:benzoyl-CoA 2,3-dioxygenase component B